MCSRLITQKMKYILVTGGVISGVGKGVIASSFGTLLNCCGIDVTSIKIDPYINIDAGTFSPYEHGKLFIIFLFVFLCLVKVFDKHKLPGCVFIIMKIIRKRISHSHSMHFMNVFFFRSRTFDAKIFHMKNVNYKISFYCVVDS